MELPKKFILFDTEYTSWEGSLERDWSREGEYKEIVQIGAIVVEDLEEKSSFLEYIKPIKNPQLSNYFTNLTGITQEDVDIKGRSFTEVLSEFFKWCNNLPMYSFGDDLLEIKGNCDLLNTPLLFDPKDSFDARAVFNAGGIDASKYYSGTIPEAFGLTPPPCAHDALNDARSILMALKAMYTTGND